MIRIWQMNDVDWVAAETREDAIQTMASVTDAEPEDVRALTDEEMNRFVYHEDIYNLENATKSFRQKLDELIAAGEKFPTMFACSDF